MQKVSLLCALRNREKDLERALEDLVGFTKKFPLQWQLILVIDASEDATLQKAQAFKADGFETTIISSPHRQGRSRSVLQGLHVATGDYVITFPIDFIVPLAEIFNFLQELITDPAIDIVLGNRMTSRKKWQAEKTSWHWTLEKILLEKAVQQKLSVQDPLCAYWAIRKTALQRILPKLRFRSWYFTLELLRNAHQQELKVIEVPILSNDKRPSSIPLIKEYLRNLF